MVALVPKDDALFAVGAIAGAASKTVTAPLDRIKLLVQTHGLRVGQESAKKGVGFIEAFTLIGKEEGLKGYWKGNLPQVIRVIPYSAAQLFAYETYKKLFSRKDGEFSVIGILAAGACAGMTSTFVSLNMIREEGFASFYNGSRRHCQITIKSELNYPWKQSCVILCMVRRNGRVAAGKVVPEHERPSPYQSSDKNVGCFVTPSFTIYR